jgi:hypothetical protein
MNLTLERKLARIRLRATAYELVATMPDRTRVLAGYCAHGRPAMLSLLRKHGAAWAERLTDTDQIRWPPGGRSCLLGPMVIAFSGRTQRQAYLEGELPFFTEGG